MSSLVVAFKPQLYTSDELQIGLLKIVKQTYRTDKFSVNGDYTGRWFLHKRVMLHSHEKGPLIRYGGRTALSYRDGWSAYDIALGCRGDTENYDNHIMGYNGSFRKALIEALIAYNEAMEPHATFDAGDVFITLADNESLEKFQY